MVIVVVSNANSNAGIKLFFLDCGRVIASVSSWDPLNDMFGHDGNCKYSIKGGSDDALMCQHATRILTEAADVDFVFVHFDEVTSPFFLVVVIGGFFFCLSLCLSLSLFLSFLLSVCLSLSPLPSFTMCANINLILTILIIIG